MRHIIFLSLFMACLSLKAQNSPKKIEAVVEVDSTTSKSELFIRANNWFFKTFNNSEAVIQLKDKSGGQLAGKAVFKYTAPQWWGGGTVGSSGYVRFTIQLYFKDGRYKYIFTDFSHEPSSDKSFGIITDSPTPPMKSHKGSKKRAELIWSDLQTKVELESKQLIDSLNESMKSSNDENW